MTRFVRLTSPLPLKAPRQKLAAVAQAFAVDAVTDARRQMPFDRELERRQALRGLEQRLNEIGLLLALGFSPSQVRRMFLLEGAGLALIGGILGTVGGLLYAASMIWALSVTRSSIRCLPASSPVCGLVSAWSIFCTGPAGSPAASSLLQSGSASCWLNTAASRQVLWLGPKRNGTMQA